MGIESTNGENVEADDAVGPFYDTEGVMALLRETDPAGLQRRIDDGEILAVKAGAVTLYPTFQFSAARVPLPGLSGVLDVLRDFVVDPWDQALWLNSAITDPDPGGASTSAARLLSEGQIDDVMRMAGEDAARLASSHREHIQPVTPGMAEIISRLHGVLGRDVVAVLVGQTQRTVTCWASGAETPSVGDGDLLRVVFQIVQNISKVDSDEIVRAWFMGMNPLLDEKSPIAVIRDGRVGDAMAAARVFVDAG